MERLSINYLRRDLLFTLASLGGALYLGWMMSDPGRLREDTLGWVRATQPVPVRHAFDILWKNRDSESLYPGSLISVPKSGQTWLVLPGERLENLKPGSVVRVSSGHGGDVDIETIFQENTFTDKVEHRAMTSLGSGLGSKTSDVVLMNPIPSYEKNAHHSAALENRLNRSLERELTLDYVDGAARYPSIYTLSAFDDYTIKTVSPHVGAIYRADLSSPCIGFVWSPVPVPGVDYVVEISKNRNFDFFRTFGASKNYVKVQANQPADYFWRVRAVKGRQSFVGMTSRFSVYKRPLPPAEARKLALKQRITDPNAWLADLEFCQ